MQVVDPFKATDHIAAEALLAVRALDLCGNANRRQHLTNGHARDRFVSEGALKLHCVERCRFTGLAQFSGEMADCRVMRPARLADLHHGEVEAEGFDLPLKLEEFAVRRAL